MTLEGCWCFGTVQLSSRIRPCTLVGYLVLVQFNLKPTALAGITHSGQLAIAKVSHGPRPYIKIFAALFVFMPACLNEGSNRKGSGLIPIKLQKNCSNTQAGACHKQLPFPSATT